MVKLSNSNYDTGYNILTASAYGDIIFHAQT